MGQLIGMGELLTSEGQGAGQLPHLFLVGSDFETGTKRGEDMRKKKQNLSEMMQSLLTLLYTF